MSKVHVSINSHAKGVDNRGARGAEAPPDFSP